MAKGSATVSKSIMAGFAGTFGSLLATAMVFPLERLTAECQSTTNETYSTIVRKLLQNPYQGLRTTMLAQLVAQYMFFSLRQLFLGLTEVLKKGLLKDFLVATCAGLITCIASNPVWLLNSRMILKTDKIDDVDISIVEAVKEIYVEGGLPAFFKGSLSSSGTAFATGLQFMFYESLRRIFVVFRGGVASQFHGIDVAFAALLSKAFAVLITYPLETLTRRLQVDKSNTGTIAFLGKILSEDG